jgi:transposase InsO family protein
MAIIERKIATSKPDTGDAAVEGAVSHLKPRIKAVVGRRHQILLEYLAGLKDVPARMCTAYAESICRGNDICRRTLDRWLRKFQDGGAPALQPNWRNGKRGKKFNREMARFTDKHFMVPYGPTVKEVYELLCKTFRGKYPLPSYRTVAAYINAKWTKAQQLLVRDKDAWNKLYAPHVRRDWSKVGLNEVWFIDSKQIDVACLFRGKVVFPWIVVIMDARSRKIFASIMVPTPNALAIGQAIVYAVSRYGSPKTIYMDRGRDYKSDYIAGLRGILAELGIEIFFAAPYNAKEKIIEPNFGWFTDRLSHLPGNRGHNLKTRPKKLASEIKSGKKLLSFEELSKIVDDLWTEKNSLPHSTTGRSPDSYWEGHQAVIPSQQLLDFLLMDVHEATVRDSSVTVKGLLYRHDELFKLSGERVEARRDPRDITRAAIIHKGAVFCAAKLETPSHYRSEITLQSVNDAARIRKKIKKFRKAIIDAPDVIDDPLRLAIELDEQEKVRQRDIRPADSNVKRFHKKEKIARDAAKAIQKDKAEEGTADAASRPDILDRYLRATSAGMGSVRPLSHNDDVEEF